MAKKTANEVDEYIGRRVKAKRKSLRMSQTELGVATGVTFQQIQKYEGGTNRIGASALYMIASVLQVDIGYFFDGLAKAVTTATSGGLAENEQSTYAAEPRDMASDDKRLTERFARIENGRTRELVIELVGTLADSQNNPPAAH